MEQLSPENYFRGGALDAARAIAAGNPVELERVLTFQLVPVNAAGEDGMTLVLYALAQSQPACLQVLLRWRADPNQVTPVGNEEFVQPVALAAGYPDLEPLRALLAHGGDPNSRRRGAPALFSAIYTLNWPALRLLAGQRGINLNLSKPGGTSPVLLLAYLNQFEQVEYLLDQGADYTLADESGGTLAFVVQSTELDPESEAYHWQQRVKQRLEIRGVKFPVPDPSVAWEEQRAADAKHRQRWHRTPEGHQWQDAVNQAAVDERTRDDDDGLALAHLRAAAEEAYQNWKALLPDGAGSK